MSTDELVVETRELLAKQVERSQKRNRKAFNMQHLEYGIPSATTIADEVFGELERLENKQQQFGDATSSNGNFFVCSCCGDRLLSHVFLCERLTVKVCLFLSM